METILKEGDIIQSGNYIHSTYDIKYSFLLTNEQKDKIAEEKRKQLEALGFEEIKIYVYETYFVVIAKYNPKQNSSSSGDFIPSVFPVALVLSTLTTALIVTGVIAGLLIIHRITKVITNPDNKNPLGDIAKQANIGLGIIAVVFIIFVFFYKE